MHWHGPVVYRHCEGEVRCKWDKDVRDDQSYSCNCGAWKFPVGYKANGTAIRRCDHIPIAMNKVKQRAHSIGRNFRSTYRRLFLVKDVGKSYRLRIAA